MRLRSLRDRVPGGPKLTPPTYDRATLKADTKAAVVLGVESVPDGLASGLLAGLNPVAGLYAYMFGVTGAAFMTSSTFMAVQGTGAMAIIVNDVDIDGFDDPTAALVTLSLLTGVVMMIAGYLRAGSLMRFVSNAVMTGFVTAVGVNIVLGQLGDFTGYDSTAGNRVTRAIDLVFHFWQIDLATTTVGVVTVALIVVLRRTRLGPMGLVVAVVAGSVLAAILAGFDLDVPRIGNIVDVPSGLPRPAAPSLTLLPDLFVPALSLTFVGLVQGAAVSSAFANPDGSRSDPSHDFVGQGVGNLVSGVFRGMPVGGSMSASSLAVSAGAKSRNALMLTGVVMAIVVLVFAPAVEYVAMPALAGLLIVVGFETIKPHNFISVLKTGHIQKTVMIITFVLTLVVPLQFAVLVGIGLAATLHVVRQSNQVTVRRLDLKDSGRIRETDPPSTVGEGEVIVIQPYGSLFFAAAPMLTDQLPEVDESSDNSVVVVRLRGKPELGSTLIDVFETYANELQEANCKLMIVTDSDRIVSQLRNTGAADVIGESNLYRSTQWLAETVRQAADDAGAWVDGHTENGEGGQR